MQTLEEERRLEIIRRVMDHWLSPEEAGGLLDLSSRQVRRILSRVEREGDIGVVHRLKGRKSNRMYPIPLKQKILRLYQTRYSHLGPTAAHRRLVRAVKIRLNRETLRRWLLEAGL